jgi:hypothetical protein
MTGEGSRSARTRRPGRPRIQHQGTLSVERAFVVHFGADHRPGHRRFNGRVEHLQSGHSAPFSSLGALLAFFAAILDAAPTPTRKGENQ